MKLDSIPMGKENDGRRRITDDQRNEMHRLHHFGESINQIARLIGCSKRSVQFILFPERAAINKANAIARKAWEPYNTKEYRLEAMRKYRAKKRELFKQGKLAIPTT